MLRLQWPCLAWTWSRSSAGTSARMVGVVDTSVAEDELRRMHAAGVRGIRFNLGPPGSGATTPEMIKPLSRRVAPLGWHVQDLGKDSRRILTHLVVREERLNPG